MAKEFPTPLEKFKADNIFKPLESVDDLIDWMYVYFDITFPKGVVYPGSTHAPADAIWRIYELMKTGESEFIPEVVMLSSRDSFKTLAAAATEVLCLVHFRFSIAHASAILSQSEKAVQYVNSFFGKIKPYLEHHGWKKTGDNKTKIEWTTENNESIYLRVLVMTRKGMNSEHLPMLFLDEIDLISDPQALEEAKMVPAVFGKYFPLTVSLSTRKYAGGLMEKKIKEVTASGGEILRWNIIDVTERVDEKTALVDQPKVVRYLRELPMESLKEKDWLSLNEEERNKYTKFEAYAGIADHRLLPIMRNYLVDRPQTNVGNLYKPISVVYNNFKQLSTDMANAQLLCNKPSSSGLVYPRFEESRNVLSIQEVYKRIFDIDDPDITLEEFREACLHIGGEFIGGGDWGYTDFTSLVVMLLIGGEVILVDAFCADQLELDDIVKYAKELNDTWNVSKWYVDQAYPAYIATLKRHGLTVPIFKKVVEDGIAALQYRISDSSGVRRFFVMRHPATEHVVQTFGEYKWSMDSKGDIIEGKPYHDNSFISDVQDSIRYPMQVLFGKPKRKPQMTISAPKVENKPINDHYGQQIMDYVKATTGADIKTQDNKPKGKKKGLVWSV